MIEKLRKDNKRLKKIVKEGKRLDFVDIFVGRMIRDLLIEL